MPANGKSWNTSTVIFAGLLAGAGLVGSAILWPGLLRIPGIAQLLDTQTEGASKHYPYLELLKLFTAALLGLIVTTVHRHTRHDKPQSNSLEHAQILLCVSGAIIMIIIGNSLARAFGIAGGASIVRFRTPVDDPKDAMVLFLLLGIGMACGLAGFGVAILAAAFLCVLLYVLSRMAQQQGREMGLSIVSTAATIALRDVETVLARSAVTFEQREISHAGNVTVRYQVLLGPETQLESISTELLSMPEAAICSVSWIKPKKSEQSL